jgi:uncharacterized phiE125 gp8 family phage protein
MILHTRTQLIEAPLIEPVSIAEVRAHMRVTHTEEDALIASLITAARFTVENITRRSLIEQKWKLVIDTFPKERFLRLPHSPTTAVEFIDYLDRDGNQQTLDPSLYWVDSVSSPARISLVEGASYPETQAGRPNCVEIGFYAGYGSTRESVPAPIRHAVKLLVAHLYENPDIVNAGQLNEIPMSCEYLLAPYRVITFF